MANTKHHPALGKMPKAGKGKCGPGMGTMPQGVDNTRIGMTGATAYAGGKGHPSAGSVPKLKNPGPVSYATVGGRRTKVGR